MPSKANRTVALRLDDQRQGHSVRVDTLGREPQTVREVSLEGLACPRRLSTPGCAHDAGSSGVQDLVTRDPTLGYADLTTRSRTRWNVEPDHTSLQQQAALEQSPPQTVTTQTNHSFGAVCGYIKLDLLSGTTTLNHVARTSKRYLRALRVACETVRTLQPVRLAA